MPGNLIVPDPLVQARASDLLTLFNAGVRAVLFDNNFTPDPDSVIADFTSASYPGYSDVVPGATWTGPTQVVPGQYALTSSVWSFPAPSSGGAATVYGVMVGDAPTITTLYFSFLFATPVTLNVGDPDLAVQVVYDVWAASLL